MRVRIIRDLPPRGPRVPVVSDPLEVLDRLGIEPDRWQREFLTCDANTAILFSCRQGGKTTMTALGTLVEAATHERTFSPIVASHEGQAAILVARAREWLRQIKGAGFRLPAMEIEQPRYSPLRIRLDNGSRIVAFANSESGVRGETATGALTIDEAAKVPDDVFTAIMPQRTMTSTQLRLLSTPWYQSGRFFEMYTEQDAPEVPRVRWRVVAPIEYGRRVGVDLSRLETSGLDHPPNVELMELTRMPYAGFLSAISGMTQEEIRREMFGIFSSEASAAVFAHATVQAALRSDARPLWGDTVTDAGLRIGGIEATAEELFPE